MRLHRRAALASLAASLAVVTLLVGGCGAQDGSAAAGGTEAAVTDVALYYSAPIAEQSLPQIALDNDLFPPDVRVDVQGGDSTVGLTLASSGRVQFYVNASPVPEQVVSGGAPLQWVASWQEGVTAQLIAREGLDSVQDLRGRRIGIIQPGLTLAVLANAALREAGLDPSDVTAVPLGTLPAVNGAFAAGTVDAIVTNASSADQLLGSVPGSTVLRDFSEDFPWNGAGVTVNTDWASDHPAAVASVLKGLNDALLLLHEDPDTAKASIGTVTGLTGAGLDAATALVDEEFTPTLVPVSTDVETSVVGVLADEGNAWATQEFVGQMLGDPSYLDQALGE